MLYEDEYNYFLGELMQAPQMPYKMGNRELAQEYYTELKKTYPTASIHIDDITEYICLDATARRNLLYILKDQQKRQELALQDTINLIAEVESEGV